ncbi:MAG TPA: hypothetical protein VME63_06560 [Dyella sp.]|uniref:hypothetical protein n=1 Tax=Dyella sp. TaxID=1869338 RepID=UPI002C6CFC3C|nr:hypothetical protein [Dyella sp.]HTV85046.1 hypothetical protein [Dyella sp.]
MTTRSNGKPQSEGATLVVSAGFVILLALFGWRIFPAWDRVNNMRITLVVLPGILRAINLPADQAQTALTAPVRVGRGAVSAVDLGIIQAAPDGDHSRVFWSRLPLGVCEGLQVHAREMSTDFTGLILTVPGHTWRDAKDVLVTNCKSLPAGFTLTVERKK